jgi:RNA recognition motif-containing protein
MNNKLYVGNLSYSTMEQSLRDAFAPYGEIVSATLVVDRMSGQSRGFGFVEYATDAEAQRAIEAMSGAELDGRTLNVSVARPREGGRGPGGGGGGGERRRGGGGGGDRRGGGGGGGRGNRW